MQQYWLALLCNPQDPVATPSRVDASNPRDQQHAIGWWALQFTPRVALHEEAILMEVAASQRLFGGEEQLRDRIRQDAQAMGCASVAWAPTAAAAVALARCGEGDGFARPLDQILDALPLQTLTAAAEHQHMLTRTGCKTLGDVRRLPRGGLSRRFGKNLLLALDGAYGLCPEAFEWLTLPDTFSAKLELPGRVELAEGLVFGARRLLMQLAGWLAARHCGTRSFTIRWKYDFHRSSDIPDFDELTIRTAETTRQVDHFARLLSEQLAKIQLGASVEEIWLQATEVELLEEASGSLLPDSVQGGETITQLLERLAARLGADKVLRAVVRSDHRPEWAQAWQPVTEPAPRTAAGLPDIPQPTWLLAQPLRLATRDEKPLYQGALSQVSGPHRVEAGWWDRAALAQGKAGFARRDYFVMHNDHAGLLLVFREHDLSNPDRSPWFLQGIFG